MLGGTRTEATEIDALIDFLDLNLEPALPAFLRYSWRLWPSHFKTKEMSSLGAPCFLLVCLHAAVPPFLCKERRFADYTPKALSLREEGAVIFCLQILWRCGRFNVLSCTAWCCVGM